MSTSLLLWNPDQYGRDSNDGGLSASRAYDEVTRYGTASVRWSCGSSQRIRAGDRLYFLKQGNRGRGVLTSGRAEAGSFQAPHWRNADEKANYVMMVIDDMVDPSPGGHVDISNHHESPQSESC
jgi:5-methylcytosine-specific restriction protein A